MCMDLGALTKDTGEAAAPELVGCDAEVEEVREPKPLPLDHRLYCDFHCIIFYNWLTADG